MDTQVGLTSDNLGTWRQIQRPPPDALKAIGGGKLKGKTDINPVWRLEKMTELFGPCGEGWGYRVVRDWTYAIAGGEVACFVEVELWYETHGKAVVCGIGGATLVAMEKGSLVLNDEAYKMATTDALSVAMKQLGMAADIYRGLWDGSKYRDAGQQSQASQPAAPPAASVAAEAVSRATAAKAILTELKFMVDGEESDEAKFHVENALQICFGVKAISDLGGVSILDLRAGYKKLKAHVNGMTFTSKEA